ncbi:MATE family efflux transporter [Lachnospiraceae bacterium OF09-6]|nr:MATE family efflux transporter [Lachnospiraceae bacterium OF09-6]
MGKTKEKTVNLTEGSVAGGLWAFTLPLMLGQLLQQLYNVADAWVIGNYADNASFAAVSAGGSLTFLVVGFFNGISIGGGVVISRYFGAEDHQNVSKAIHTNVLFGVAASILATIVTVIFTPAILVWMQTPENVLPYSITYFRIYFAGISMIILYNIFMAIMRAVGDSVHPLYYLCISSVVNVILDLVLVAGMHMGVTGAALATVVSQGLSAILCLIRMQRTGGYMKIHLSKLRYDGPMMRRVLYQGLPAGIQNSALSIGNIVVQANINAFGEFAMSGMGAHSKIEGFVFIPIISISNALSTFVSQNLGAGEVERAQKGAFLGTVVSMGMAVVMGIGMYLLAPQLIRIFTSEPQSVEYGVVFMRTVTFFYLFLTFSHEATGILRGLGMSVIPMLGMFGFWCVGRILYVTIALRVISDFRVICWAYPLTWICTTAIFSIVLFRTKWRAG